MFRRRPPVVELAAGQEFRRTVLNNVVETARVIALAEDNARIPHVRFALRHSLEHGREVEELRTLSRDSFLSRFDKRVA